LYLRFLTSVATARYCAGLGTIADCPRDIGRELLAKRDAMGKPIVEVVTEAKDIKKAVRLHMCEQANETWGLDEDSEDAE
jgi:hypothetical protein